MKKNTITHNPSLTRLFYLTLIAAYFQLAGTQVFGSSTATTSADATTTIIADIAIAKNQDLQFGTGAASDSAKVVAPTDTTNAAKFTVTGQASTAYTITLPSSITMTTGAGNTADLQIVVNTFTSNPSSTGTLSGAGSQVFYVGATRAAIRASQTTGSYTASFNVTVNY